MKTISAFLAVILLSSLSSFAAADGPKTVAQAFYDGYMKVLLANGDTEKYVLSDDRITASFKKAYKKLLADGMESDPIICGQDYPDAGFSASLDSLDGTKATVVMKSRDDEFKHSFKVTLRKVKDAWKISDTNDLKADAND